MERRRGVVREEHRRGERRGVVRREEGREERNGERREVVRG